MTLGLSGEDVHVRANDGEIGGVKNLIYAEVAIYKKKRNANRDGRLVERQL